MRVQFAVFEAGTRSNNVLAATDGLMGVLTFDDLDAFHSALASNPLANTTQPTTSVNPSPALLSSRNCRARACIQLPCACAPSAEHPILGIKFLRILGATTLKKLYKERAVLRVTSEVWTLRFISRA